MTVLQHFRFTWSGVFGASAASPVEIWSCSVALGTPGTTSAAAGIPTQAQFDSMVNNVVAYHGRVATGINSKCFLTDVRLALISTTGHVARAADGSFQQQKTTLTTPVGGGTGDTPLPPQLAIAVSLQSATPGRTGRGRFFLPGVALGVASDLRMTAPNALAIATSTKTFLDSLEFALGGTTERVVVASAGSVSEGLPPANRQVTSIRVGRVYDTIRTRRNALDEGYQVVAR